MNECMNRNGLKRIITPNQMRAPVKPEAAYDRQRWNQAEEGDDKLIKDYEKLDIAWDQGCNIVDPAFLRVLRTIQRAGIAGWSGADSIYSRQLVPHDGDILCRLWRLDQEERGGQLPSFEGCSQLKTSWQH